MDPTSGLPTAIHILSGDIATEALKLEIVFEAFIDTNSGSIFCINTHNALSVDLL